MTARIKIILFIIALIALITGVWTSYQYAKKDTLQNLASTVLTPPRPIAVFSLIDTRGRAFNNNSFWGHWTFVFFGFTGCAQICPPTMNNLNKMYELFLQQKQNPMPQVVFISIDPENDTLSKLGDYVRSFNPHFQGATGDKAQLDKLAESLNVLYIQSAVGKNSEKTPIDHSGAILLIDPAGKLAAIFSAPHSPEAMVKDFNLIVKHSG